MRNCALFKALESEESTDSNEFARDSRSQREKSLDKSSHDWRTRLSGLVAGDSRALSRVMKLQIRNFNIIIAP